MRQTRLYPESLITLVIKLSICALFCALAMLAGRAEAQTLNNKTMTSKQLQYKVKQIYTSQIGVREEKSNSGAYVEGYLRYVKLPKGQPWCAAFVCWVLGKAGIKNPMSGWSPDLFKRDKVVWEKNNKKQKPSMGDVFGLYFPEKKRIAHVGFIDEWKEPWVITVEGNTNETGSREGDGVYRKMRLVSSLHKVSRYITN